MLGFLCRSVPASIPKSITTNYLFINPTPPLPHHPHFIKSRNRRRTHSVTLASNNDDDPITTTTVSDDVNEDKRSPLFDFKWSDLLNPDADNVLAVGLTGLLTWASVQVLWQLLFISFAILVAAVKYSFIAAILLFILITLL